MSDFDDIPEVENRVRALEDDDNAIWAELRDIKRRLAAAEQKALNAGRTPPGGGATEIGWALAAGGGIAAAAVSGTTPNFVITPSSASCIVLVFDSGTNTYIYSGSSQTVFNDWPNSTGSGVAGAHWVQVYLSPQGDWRVLGEQC